MSQGRDRLLGLKADNDAAGLEMVVERGRFDLLRDDSSKPQAVSAFNLFQTPPDIADRMAAIVLESLSDDAVILEPSAGLGRLYKALRRAGSGHKIILAEESTDCCKELYRITEGDHNVTLRQGDYLRMGMPADAVIMNPPFRLGRDIKHITHALAVLRPGGRLVSLCYNGAKQAKHLQPIADTWEVLPEGSFKIEGTAASVALLTVQKART